MASRIAVFGVFLLIVSAFPLVDPAAVKMTALIHTLTLLGFMMGAILILFSVIFMIKIYRLETSAEHIDYSAFQEKQRDA